MPRASEAVVNNGSASGLQNRAAVDNGAPSMDRGPMDKVHLGSMESADPLSFQT